MWSLADFDLGPRLGGGTFGHVQLARERASKKVVALKVLKKRRVERLRAQRHVSRELSIQGHLRHPGIVRLHGFFWDASRIYMILERSSGGDLRQLLSGHPARRLEDGQGARLSGQVASAIAYCHALHVMHRDVKPENILLSQDGKRAKLADFGWAVHHGCSEERRWTLCGTLDYLAPEMVHGTCGHSFGVDDWALGVLIFEMLVGALPFSAPSQQETCHLILAASPQFPPHLAWGPRELIAGLLRQDPCKRMRSGVAAEHTWATRTCEEDEEEHRDACGVICGSPAALAGA